jgi:hypothetical protein
VKKSRLTGYEDILVRRPDELHCLLGEHSHIFICCIPGNSFVGAIVQSNQDIEENCQIVSDNANGNVKGALLVKTMNV